jgi:hypothetical protein
MSLVPVVKVMVTVVLLFMMMVFKGPFSSMFHHNSTV